MSDSITAYYDDEREYTALCTHFGEEARRRGNCFDSDHFFELRRRWQASAAVPAQPKPKPARPTAFDRITKDEDDFE